MKESVIQKKIIDLVRSHGGYIIKVITATSSGVPDLIACVKGKFIAIEVKTPTGIISPLQERNIKQIHKAAGVGIIARSVEEVEDLLSTI